MSSLPARAKYLQLEKTHCENQSQRQPVSNIWNNVITTPISSICLSNPKLLIKILYLFELKFAI